MSSVDTGYLAYFLGDDDLDSDYMPNTDESDEEYDDEDTGMEYVEVGAPPCRDYE